METPSPVPNTDSGSAGPRAASGPPAVPDSSEIARLEALERQAGTQRAFGDLDAMLERGYIRVLVPYNRFFFFHDGAQPRGIAYELMERFAAGLRGRGRRLTVLYLPVPRDRLIPHLVEGYGDIALAGLTDTPGRERLIDFVTYPRAWVSELLVTGPGAPPLRSLDDLAGREVFVRRSSSYFESLEALDSRLRDAGRPPVQVVPAHEDLETEDILELVAAGVHPVTVADDYIARFWAGLMPGLTVHDSLVLRRGARIGPAIRKDSPVLAAALRRFIEVHGIGTEFGNILLHRYLRDNRWVRDPGARAEWARLQRTLPLFRRYAKRYDFDALLLVAQGYQESRLDQRLRSRAGAVGVMQIRPSTAAGRPINIHGVERDLEANIHAGVKYLRYLSDEYFDEPGIDDLNRHVFAIASYNAGPARIQGLRRKAAAQGLDPNVWFCNVEVVSGREIGRENVEYVRNILKYWVAYSLASGRGDGPLAKAAPSR